MPTSRPLLLDHEPLFKWEDPYNYNAYIHEYDIYQWDLYAIGYKYSGDLIIDSGLDQYHLDINKYFNMYRTVDVLVWPAIFLYRQYLELRLKAIIIRGNMLQSHVDCVYPPIHEIDKVWKDCRPIIESLNTNSQSNPSALAELEVMDKYIEEFSNLDENSFTFRYPVNKKDKKPWKYRLKQLSLKNLRDIMDKIFSYLEEQNRSLDGAIEYENEFGHEAYSPPEEY
jgi:hypothetical protein